MKKYIISAILINLNISSSMISILDLHMWNISEFIPFMRCFYCTGGLAYMTLQFRTISVIVTIARNVEIITIHGTRKIVKKNITLDNIKYIAINASVKSFFETIVFVLVLSLFVDVGVNFSVNRIQCSTVR